MKVDSSLALLNMRWWHAEEGTEEGNQKEGTKEKKKKNHFPGLHESRPAISGTCLEESSIIKSGKNNRSPGKFMYFHDSPLMIHPKMQEIKESQQDLHS